MLSNLGNKKSYITEDGFILCYFRNFTFVSVDAVPF